MITFIPTGSQMDRIAHCPASAALPQVRDANDNKARDRGTAMHKFLERVALAGREIALTEVDDEHRPFCAGIDITALTMQLSLSPEFALAYDWRNDTARALQPVEHRAYEVDESSEIPLTIDVAGVGHRTVYAGDFKSGYGWLPEPSQSMQLGLGALALARLHRARSARVEYMRVRDDGSVYRFAAVVDSFGLEATANRVSKTMRVVEELHVSVAAGTIPNVVEGPWCGYCPARHFCPAKTALVRSVLDAKPVSLREALTPANVSSAYLMLRRAKEGFSLLEKAIHAYVRDGEVSTPGHVSPTAIPLGPDPDGSMRFFGMFDRLGNEKLDGSKTYEVLAKRYGADVATKAVEMETTKKAIEDVVRANLKPDEKIGATREAIVEEIRALGGSKRGKPDKPTEFTFAPDGTAKATKRKTG